MSENYLKRCQGCGEWTTYSQIGNSGIFCIFCREKEALRCRKLAGPFFKAFKKEIIEEFAGKCYYCRKPADTIDHLVPLSRGGKNFRLNLVAACRRCNCQKADKTPLEYSDYLKEVAARQPR